MSDLVERLRKRKGFWLNGATWVMSAVDDPDCQEAADEIEHLDGIIKTAMGGKGAFEDRITLIKEIERLRADLQFSYENKAASDDTWRKECERLRAALELFIQTVNPPYPQSMALWQEHLKAATENARKALAEPHRPTTNNK